MCTDDLHRRTRVLSHVRDHIVDKPNAVPISVALSEEAQPLCFQPLVDPSLCHDSHPVLKKVKEKPSLRPSFSVLAVSRRSRNAHVTQRNGKSASFSGHLFLQGMTSVRTSERERAGAWQHESFAK
jgi:hypothetical protein